ncbi:DNA alkylation repair protein [Hydrogenophaga pseudoflava]|uniref:DNA alkylation repair protein n=1 Tax=Hydrogenophaga pseudoflava TaxID=47421 RepID=UPI0027E521DB|nr:DNA alkylation repair protein [Hydrogenophaga pseudoflava]MDQ7747237.1 DNA alkylation repair protein [Hydrogenophaga pseudoflava]
MAEPFKNLISTRTVNTAGRHLQRVWPRFNRAAFERQAASGLDALEFKARAMQLADALEATLPDRFAHAADLIEASLAPPTALDADGEPVGLANNEHGGADEAGLRGWVVWSLAEFVARRGMDDLPRALACLHALTQRFSAEFAIRPFIQRHPNAVFATLAQWVHDPSAHVRRLVSEGSRPRLPWGLRLQALVADPSPSLPLLRALQDDASAYVRRSVANHLNDIAKDHPDLVAGWVQTHRPGASAHREALLRHASRSLVKQGHAPTLAAWGLGRGLEGRARLRLSAPFASIGGDIGLEVDLHSTAPAPQTLVIDYLVHHVRANGGTSPKVFKGWKRVLEPGERCTLGKRHSLRPVTTRTLYPGRHRIELQINGVVCAEAVFELHAPPHRPNGP